MSGISITDDALKHAAKMVRQSMLGTLPALDECNHDFSPEFEEKMEKLMEIEQRRRTHPFARRIAAIFLAALVGAGVWLSVDTRARAVFVNWIREVYQTHIAYRFFGELPKEAIPEYHLNWLPVGYTEITTEQSNDTWLYVYQHDENVVTFVYYLVDQDEFGRLYNLGSKGTPMIVNGYQGHFYLGTEDSPSSGLAWIDEARCLFFMISGPLSCDDMLHMAESLCLDD